MADCLSHLSLVKVKVVFNRARLTLSTMAATSDVWVSVLKNHLPPSVLLARQGNVPRRGLTLRHLHKIFHSDNSPLRHYIPKIECFGRFFFFIQSLYMCNINWNSSRVQDRQDRKFACRFGRLRVMEEEWTFVLQQKVFVLVRGTRVLFCRLYLFSNWMWFYFRFKFLTSVKISPL